MFSRTILRNSIIKSQTQVITPFPRAYLFSIRFNSTLPPSNQNNSKIQKKDELPIKEGEEEEEAQAWLDAVKELRERYISQGIPDYESAHMKQLKSEVFEPSEEQLAKYASLQDKPIPLRNDPVVQHCTNMVMKDGKKSKAQKYIARALYIVRLKLRQDPVNVLKETLDKLGPLMETKTYKTRVAKNLVVPVPLNQRQRYRRAFLWILEGSDKRRSKDFSVRLGEEIIDAYLGRSSGYDKRAQIHKQAMLHRAYVKLR
ncbi:hypothetical protein WICMUC_005357 [Wickerhamomyces mucosus]|uniref:Small ribosomal subunit protein uS7m n=1 Tax=Wickerhamomyces mucosus TaxID=1378264 RepID=A0A9P8T6E4_9ASCO|nr:hypothetical protein WICMUC_005357 [Wickerhamomyces mucosus]